MCQEIPRGYSRKRENVKVPTNSGEQRGQDQSDKNTTLKTKKQMNNMDPAVLFFLVFAIAEVSFAFFRNDLQSRT